MAIVRGERGKTVIDKEFIAVFHYDAGGSNRCGAEPYRYAEEIVRCKECKYGQEDLFHMFCAYHHHKTYADDFCSYGEREGER